MRTKNLSLVLTTVLVMLLSTNSFAQSSCSGTRSTPVRSTLSAVKQIQPVRSILSKLSKTTSGCSGSTATLSCAGSSALSCAGSVSSVKSLPPVPAACSCGCERGSPCNCSPQKTAAAVEYTVAQHYVSLTTPQFATPIRTAMSSAYQQALASAQYRAANRIHGHSYLDTHRTSGVGWATSDPTPKTCLGRGGEAYAVVRGADGWYATKFN